LGVAQEKLPPQVAGIVVESLPPGE
jgi:hypothetical protein